MKTLRIYGKLDCTWIIHMGGLLIVLNKDFCSYGSSIVANKVAKIPDLFLSYIFLITLNFRNV